MKQVHQKNVSFATIGFYKGIGLIFEENVCNKCHDLSTMTHYLKNIAILSANGTTFRCILMGSSKNEALSKLNNSVTRDGGILEIWTIAQKKIGNNN